MNRTAGWLKKWERACERASGEKPSEGCVCAAREILASGEISPFCTDGPRGTIASRSLLELARIDAGEGPQGLAARGRRKAVATSR